MRLAYNNLTRLTIDPATAREIGWLAPHGRD